jgi:outer membrane protein assembly factor BamB
LKSGSSPIAADGKLYVSNEDGQTFAIRAGPRFKLLATNQLGELVLSTPALSDAVLYIRTPGSVIAIAE